VLARFFDKEYSGKDGDKIKSTIDAFGKESGLYKKIKVKKLGEMITDPFQVNATIFSKATNLLDVGYGVSQALPVVVQSILMNSRNILLLQQPEVHLHPRAQAALGTFFCGLVSTSERQFVIETHSDYIIDRVRQEVARGNIDKEKVLILFLHKTRNETQVFPLSLDELGNVRNAPSSYREFFIQEDINLLSRSR
jgi:predicted ATPase